MSLAVIVIASEKRRETTFPRCLRSVMEQHPDEIAVVADFAVEAKGVRSLVVEPMLRNTIDALVKRDVGWIGTVSSHLLYLCDDHILDEDFMLAYRRAYAERGDWDILVPARYCYKPHEQTPTWLNVGRDLGYAGGHACIERRECGYVLPWSATLHHPNWDVIRSHQLTDAGLTLAYTENDMAIVDIEGGTPWL